MVTACSSRRVTQYTPRRYPIAGRIRANFVEHDVDHTVFSMVLAVPPSLATLEIERRILCALFLRAALVTDVDHAVLSMLFAVFRRLAALHIEGRQLGT